LTPCVKRSQNIYHPQVTHLSQIPFRLHFDESRFFELHDRNLTGRIIADRKMDDILCKFRVNGIEICPLIYMHFTDALYLKFRSNVLKIKIEYLISNITYAMMAYEIISSSILINRRHSEHSTPRFNFAGNCDAISDEHEERMQGTLAN